MLLQLLLTVPMLFAIFPQTKDLAYQLFFYIWDPVKSILYGILAYIPNLFTIFIICLAIKYLVRPSSTWYACSVIWRARCSPSGSS